MSSKSKRLGTLADIFQSETLEGTIRKIKLSKIIPSNRQPRSERLKAVEELAESIQAEGLLQPLVVNKINNEDSYKIIAGERRFHAVSKLGWTEVECKILNKSDKDIYRLAVIENLQRENLSAFDEAESLSILKTEYSYSDLDIATIFGKSRNYISEILSISQLTPENMRLCREAKIENKNLLIQAAQAAKKGDFTEFLARITSGAVRTVKDAKKFNSPKNTEHKQRSQAIEIKRKNHSILITSEDSTILDKFEAKIKTYLSEIHQSRD